MAAASAFLRRVQTRVAGNAEQHAHLRGGKAMVVAVVLVHMNGRVGAAVSKVDATARRETAAPGGLAPRAAESKG